MLAVAPASAVNAASAVSASPAAGAPDFTPSGSKPREFILNILGRVLGSAMPDKWRAEQLANQYRYNYGWETLNMEFGFDSASPGPYNGLPNTYDDYVIRKTEQDLKGGTKGKPMAPPATGPSKFVKAVGGAAVGVTGFAFGTQIGNGVLGLFGYDTNGAVCGSLDGGWENLASLVTGADCAAYDFAEGFVPNQGVVSGEIISGECVTGQSTTAGADALTPTCGAGYARKYNFVTGSITSQDKWRAVKITGATASLIASGALAGRYQVVVTGSSDAGSGASAQENRSGVFVGGWCITSAGKVGAAYNSVTWTPPATGGAQSYSVTLTPQPGANSTNCASVMVLQGNRQSDDSVIWGMVFRQGYPMVPATISTANPERTLVCTIHGDDGNDYTAVSEPFYETGSSIATPTCPALPDGVGPESVRIDETGNGGTETLYDADVTPAYMDWWNTYPECRTGACKLDLIDLRNPSYPVSCFDLDNECEGWFESPTRLDDYECHYGIHTVDLEECFVYAGVFNQARILSGAPYSDPMTGTWSGGQNAPAPDEQAFGQGLQDPVAARRCAGLASDSFDPVAFVMRPIQCALEWAFVPRETVIKVAVLELEGAWASSFLGSIGSIVGQFSALPIYTGCSGIPIYIEFDWPIEWVLDWNFGASCTGPLATTASTVRLIESAGLVFLGVRVLTGYFGGVIGFRGFGRDGGGMA